MLLGAGVPLPVGTAQAPLNSSGMAPFTSPTLMQQFHGVQTDSDLQLYHSYFPPNPVGATNLGQIPPTLRPISVADRCLDSFYYNFHASHPFVLPKPYLLSLSSESALEPLLAAVRWVGSLFIEVEPARQGLFDEAYRLIYEPQRARDGFLVQAMMLLIVALDGSCENDKARHLLGDVESIAIQIGLNNRAFATLNGRAMPVIEESWRRTWWDLFIIDGMIAGVHRLTNFFLYDVHADVALPCEEHQYMSGVSGLLIVFLAQALTNPITTHRTFRSQCTLMTWRIESSLARNESSPRLPIAFSVAASSGDLCGRRPSKDQTMKILLVSRRYSPTGGCICRFLKRTLYKKTAV